MQNTLNSQRFAEPPAAVRRKGWTRSQRLSNLNLPNTKPHIDADELTALYSLDEAIAIARRTAAILREREEGLDRVYRALTDPDAPGVPLTFHWDPGFHSNIKRALQAEESLLETLEAMRDAEQERTDAQILRARRARP